MRALIFGTVLLAVASAACYAWMMSASLAVARDARPATFSERFAPALKQG
jgi:hypothetical protein